MEIGDILEGDYPMLVETPADKLQDNLLSTVKYLRDEGMAGIYVSINKPYKTVNEMLTKKDIGADKMFFIDCITGASGINQNSVSFIPNISDLGSLSIEIARFIDKIPDRKFLVIDAIHTLWIYHTPEVIARFIQNLAERSYRAKVRMIVFIVESEDERLIRRLAPLFDLITKSECKNAGRTKPN